jgi:type II secretory pathway pseudopilin PulG
MKLLRTETIVSRRAYTIVEVLISVFLLAIMMISLYGGFSAGFAVVKLSRENLRATQIMVQKMEALRLLNWSQILNTNVYVQTAFTSYYNPAGTNNGTYGTLYSGRVSTNAPSNVPVAYRNNMRSIIVTVFWTNYPMKPYTNVIVRSRQMQTYVARYGMQNYIYQ